MTDLAGSAGGAAPVSGPGAEQGSAAWPSAPDMHDSPDDLDRWPALRTPLLLCREILEPEFAASNAAALRHQRAHALLTVLAALCGTGAILAAVVQLSFEPYGMRSGQVEAAAAAAALLSLALGLVTTRHADWILERHKAECYRLAKFRLLTDPSAWQDGPADAGGMADRLHAEIHDIRGQTPRGLRRRVEQDRTEVVATLPFRVALEPELLAELVSYYQAKRAAFQRDMFAERAERSIVLDRLTRYLTPVFFFGSVAAVLAYFGCDLWLARGPGGSIAPALPFIGRCALLLALALPVIAAGLRTLRMVQESARNSSRFRAKEVALSRLLEVLGTEGDASAKFRQMWYCEQILEFEHFEWLRLMIRAEWFA